MSGRTFSIRRGGPSSSHSPGACGARSLRPRTGRLSRHAALARSRLLGCAPPARRSRQRSGGARALPLPAHRRRGLAPDSRRPGACRHHRARAFPFYRQRRDGGSVGAAPWLRAQRHRGVDGGRQPRHGRAPGRAHLRRQHGGLRACLCACGRGGNGGRGSAPCGILREKTLRAAQSCFGHRLMMDAVVPGGVAHDLGPSCVAEVAALLEEVRRLFPKLVELYDNTTSLQDRTATTGVLRSELARQFGAGGYVGRASGRAFDARKVPGYPPYDRLDFEVPVFEAGDVNARVWVRIREVEQSLALIDQILRHLPAGAIRVEIDPPSDVREGLAMAEAFRGDVLVWMRLEGGRVARCHLRDPSWFQWPLLEAAIEGNIVADFPLCNKSFNCSYSGHDL